MRCQYCGRYFPFQKKDVTGHIVIIKTKEGFWTEAKMDATNAYYILDRLKYWLNVDQDRKGNESRRR